MWHLGAPVAHRGSAGRNSDSPGFACPGVPRWCLGGASGVLTRAQGSDCGEERRYQYHRVLSCVLAAAILQWPGRQILLEFCRFEARLRSCLRRRVRGRGGGGDDFTARMASQQGLTTRVRGPRGHARMGWVSWRVILDGQGALGWRFHPSSLRSGVG